MMIPSPFLKGDSLILDLTRDGILLCASLSEGRWPAFIFDPRNLDYGK
jgi:hypothetical protein